MSDGTGIEWTDTTWNPTTGCDKVSPGCGMPRPGSDDEETGQTGGCYAMTMARRLKAMGQAKYQKDGDPRTSGPGFGITVHPDTLHVPFTWEQPRKVFVNSMSDLFHKGVSDEFIAEVFAVMAAAHQHTFQVLTKRHARMRAVLSDPEFRTLVQLESATLAHEGVDVTVNNPWETWPLQNVWLGVSVEDQQRADLRIPALMDTSAAVRFLSCEPLIGPVDLSRLLTFACPDCGRSGPWTNGRSTRAGDECNEYWCQVCFAETPLAGCTPNLHWVIVGGESGPKARPMHPDWARSLRDQCTAAGVAYLFKQWGQWGLEAPVDAEGRIKPGKAGLGCTLADDGTLYQPGDLSYPDGPRHGEAIRAGHDKAHLTAVYRVGKHTAGRELDGRTWDEYPQAVTR